MKFNLYGADPWATIAMEGLLEMQREEGMLWAHAEDSGSESCYCEVARWNAATRRYERFAFCKCADYRFPELPDATDEVTAEHAAQLINDLIPCNMRVPIVHRLPNWSEANRSGSLKRTIYRFLLTVDAPADISVQDVQSALELLVSAGQADLAESLELPDEERWDTEIAAALKNIKLAPLKEAP